MKVKFYCNSGANIHSRREEILDVERDLGLTEEEWEELSTKDKQEIAMDWAWERLEIGFKEL